MSDDTKLSGGQDRTRINLEQDHEVRYWTKALDCTETQLRDAVRRAGSPVVDKVRAALQKS